MTDLRDSLAQVQVLLGRATPRPWASAHSFRGVYSQHPTPGPVQVCRAPEHFHDTWRGNAEAMVAAVNWLREHGPELMKRMEGKDGR